MDYEWEIEHNYINQLDFEELQRIICEKIANIIIKTEKGICTIWLFLINVIIISVLLKH